MTTPNDPRLIDDNQAWGDGTEENPHTAVPAESTDEMLTGEPGKPVQSDLIAAEISDIHDSVENALYGTDETPEDQIMPPDTRQYAVWRDTLGESSEDRIVPLHTENDTVWRDVLSEPSQPISETDAWGDADGKNGRHE